MFSIVNSPFHANLYKYTRNFCYEVNDMTINKLNSYLINNMDEYLLLYLLDIYRSIKLP